MRDLRTYTLGRRRSIDHDIREVFICFGYPEFVEFMPGHDAKLTPMVFEGQRIARQFSLRLLFAPVHISFRAKSLCRPFSLRL